MSKNLFLLCHYWLFGVEFWDKKWTQYIVEYVCNVIKQGEGERGVQTLQLDCKVTREHMNKLRSTNPM